MNARNSLAAIEELVLDYDYVKDSVLKVDMSVAQNLQRHLTKMLILACASYYENSIARAIFDYSQNQAKKYCNAPHGFDFVGTYSFFKMFDFGREKLKTVKEFLGPMNFLGATFKQSIITEISQNEEIVRNMQAFQEICSMRNSLAHNDLITYSDMSSKSFEEIKGLHDRGVEFLNFLVSKFE